MPPRQTTTSHEERTVRTSRTLRRWIGFTLPLILGPPILGVGNEDFETSVLGSFPPAPWLDVGQVTPFPSTPEPSAVVVDTLDASDNPTRAVALVDALTESTQGIYQTVAVSERYHIIADVRIDRFSNNSLSDTADWPLAVGFAAMTGDNPAFVPQIVVFASSRTERWRLFAIGNGDPIDLDLGVAAALDTWYRLEIDLDVATGQVKSRLRNLETDGLLVDRTDTITGWVPGNNALDAVILYEGETSLFGSPPPTISNLAVIDNVVCPEIFADGFESGDLAAWSSAVPGGG